MNISICITTRNKSKYLRRTLDSILQQGFSGEIIVSDDGSTDDTRVMLQEYPVIYFHRENDEYHNGVWGKNSSLRAATGDIIIQQSDDVIHKTPDCIARLSGGLIPGEFHIATVYDYDCEKGLEMNQYTGASARRPLFFLGACWREDVCKIGGYDEDFAHVVWYDDDWHAHGLLQGLGLKCRWIDEVVGLHQDHPRPKYTWSSAEAIYLEKKRRAASGNDKSLWFAKDGSWPFVPGKSVNEVILELGNVQAGQ